jgi:sugar lactone lactonase YvrE
MSDGNIMSDVTIVATGLGFPEGPVACADGSIVLTEIRNNRCSRVTRDGQVSLFSATGGGPNGLAIGPDGAFYLCNNGGSRYVEGTSMGQGPHLYPTNICFGGPDMRTAYITLSDSGRLARMQWPEPGLKLNFG